MTGRTWRLMAWMAACGGAVVATRMTALMDAVMPVTTSFQAVIGGPAHDRGIFVSPTRDGGYVAVGATRSFGAGGDDIYLVRVDASGTERWSRTFGGPKSDNGWSVLETADGFVVAGFTESLGAGAFDCELIRTDADGRARWSRTYGTDGNERCWAVLSTGDGYVLAGEAVSEGRDLEDCFLIRTDADGEQVWSRTFGGAKGDRCFSIAQAEDGGFLLAGQTYSEGAGDRDVYLVRTDASGVEQWSKTFGGPMSDVGHSVVRLDGGDFLVTGYTTSFAEEREDDPYLIKVGASGDVRWTRVIPLEGVNHTLTGDRSADGGFLLGGFSEHRAAGATSALVVKTDADGKVEWSRDLASTTSGESLGYTVRATPDGGGILTGHTTVGSAGGLDLLLVKLDRNGS